MKKATFRLLMLAAATTLGLASCTTSSDDNPVINPDEPQQQLADYTIIYYGLGGGDLDLGLLDNITQFHNADAESRRNVNICVQFKFSNLEGLQKRYRESSMLMAPNDPEQVAYVERLPRLYPYAGKTSRFVVGQETGLTDADAIVASHIIGPDNADVTRVDSLTNFINWAAQVCPARKYILLMSDHGGGYLPYEERPVADAAQARTRGVMYDDGHNSSHFTAKTLTQAISQASVRPNAVYLDACLMNTAEYQFELAPLTDYLVLSTFVVPGQGGDYVELVNALSDNPDNPEEALKHLAKASVAAWDENHEGDPDPYYHDMSVYRTAGIDAFGAELKKFTDLLIDTYQNGGDEVRAKIDEVTANDYRIEETRPEFDLMHYLFNLTATLPDVFNPVFGPLADQYYNHCFVIQQSSKWLEENGHTVSLNVLLGCQGRHTLIYKDDGYDVILHADGTTTIVLNGQSGEGYPWGSTLDATYGQLRFDQITDWSRWIRLNQQEPNREAFFEYRDFDSQTWTEGDGQDGGKIIIL